jgi:hypothetical protein
MTAAPQDPDADDVPARRDALASGADSSGLTPERLLDLAERMAVSWATGRAGLMSHGSLTERGVPVSSAWPRW